MTLTYARISDRTVADEYFRVTQAVEPAYDKTRPLPAHLEGANMKRLAVEAHRRLLGAGYCNRPVGVDCIHETICEQCGFFETGPQFVTLLRRQRNHANKRGDHTKTTLFDELIHGVDTPA